MADVNDHGPDEFDLEKVWWGQAHGPTYASVESVLAQSKQGGIDGVMAELALAAADLVDSSKINQDPRLWLASSQRLMLLLEKKVRPSGGIQEELFDTLSEDPE